MHSTKLLGSLLSLSLSAGLAIPAYAQESGQQGIAIVHTNDVHCGGLLAQKNKDGTFSSVGYDGVVQAKADLQKQYGQQNVTLVDAGDAIQGQPIGTLTKGEDIVRIMNKAGYDIAVPGNHEFDYGVARLLQLAEMADYDYISCNIINTQTNKPLFKGYEVETYEVGSQEVSVAYVGITTPVTLTSTSPAVFEDEQGQLIYSFYQGDDGQALYSQVQKVVDEASQEADYVVAIAHLGIPASSSVPEIYTSQAVIENTSGIDAMIDGHTHEIYNTTVKNKLGQEVSLSQCGMQLQAYGTLIINPDGDPDPSDITSELTIAAKQEEIPVNEGMTSFIEEIQDGLNVYLSQKAGENRVPLSFLSPDDEGKPWWYTARMHETNLGDFVADAYRAKTGAQIGLVNGGGVRWKDQVCDIEPGILTVGNMIDINPYANSISMVEIKGQALLDALEYSVRMLTPAFDDETEANGGFLQVSGISFDADISIPSPVVTNEDGSFSAVKGTRRVSNVKVGGEALDPEKDYTLGTITYLIEGGSGYTMFKDATYLLSDASLDYESLLDYLQQDLKGVIDKGYENAEGSGRINLFAAQGSPFTDVNPDAWYAPAIDLLYQRKIMTGLNATTFGVNDPINRAQFITALFRMMEPQKALAAVPSQTKNETPFTDCVSYAYYTPALNWAYENKLITGFTGSSFEPSRELTCEQITTILYRAFGNEDPGDPDVLDDFMDSAKISAYARDGMIWAVNEGLIHGSNGALLPDTAITRSRTAMILYNGLVNHIFD